MGKSKDHKEEKDKSKKKDKKDKKQSKDSSNATSSSTTQDVKDSNGFDPSLDSLFSHSSGPVQPRATVVAAPETSDRSAVAADTAVIAQINGVDDEDEDELAAAPKNIVVALTASRDALTKPRKKKRKRDTTTAVENDYLDKLMEEGGENSKKRKREQKEKKEKKEKKAKADVNGETEAEAPDAVNDTVSDDQSKVDVTEKESEANAMDIDTKSDDEQASDSNADDNDDKKEDDSEAEDASSSEDEDEEPPRHESLTKEDTDVERAKRTVFIGNLPPTVISSKEHYNTLKSKLKTYGPVESIRFRSIAFSDLIPRKAAFITKSFHTDMSSVNAYAVFKKADGARASLQLNGKVLLDRHLRMDSVAHPAKHDAKRAVFVGNLDFEACEESLWRHFASCGDVENVRIVRDSKTNMGKGIAYVSFVDGVSVDSALLLDGKPMAPLDKNDKEAAKKAAKRKLRITRSKNLSKKHHSQKKDAVGTVNGGKKGAYVPKQDPRTVANIGRAGKLLGRAGAAKMKRTPGGDADNAVFEGLRATKDTDPGLKKGGTGKRKGKPRAKAMARSSAWKQKAKKA